MLGKILYSRNGFSFSLVQKDRFEKKKQLYLSFPPKKNHTKIVERENECKISIRFTNKTKTSLTHLFPIHSFSTPKNMRKPYGF